jgi:hypothetical protein
MKAKDYEQWTSQQTINLVFTNYSDNNPGGDGGDDVFMVYI